MAKPLEPRKQLLNHMVDDIARATPSAVWAETPISTTSYEPGFRKITYAMLANAINGVAWWMRQTLGPAHDFETLAYFGPWDIRYILLLLGSVKAGYKMVFPSPEYSVAELAVLLDELKCKRILAPSTSPTIVPELLALHPLNNLIKVQEVEEILAHEYIHFAYPKSFVSARQEPLVVLHTSDTTSHPKPILWTHDYAASLIQQNQSEPPPGKQSVMRFCDGNRLIPVLPLYEAGSLFTILLTTIPNRTTTVYPLLDAELSADTLVDILKHVDANVAIVPPIIAQQIATDPIKLDFIFEKLDALGFSGGKLAKFAGDALARRGQLFPVFGSTANGLSLTLRSPATSAADAWACMEFHPKAGYDFRHVGNGCYEAIVIRNTPAEDEQPVFKVYPQLTEWSTREVFTPHPSISGVWIYCSRADDILILDDGTTFNPLEYEQLICAHPDVRSALMLGAQSSRARLLIELERPQDAAEGRIRATCDALSPVISQAHERYIDQSKISTLWYKFTHPEKPLPRTPTGTVQRSAAIRLYADLFETLTEPTDQYS